MVCSRYLAELKTGVTSEMRGQGETIGTARADCDTKLEAVETVDMSSLPSFQWIAATVKRGSGGNSQPTLPEPSRNGNKKC